MIDIEFKGVQVAPNPAYAGESFLISVFVSGKAVRWDGLKNKTWNQVKDKRWD